MATGGKISIGPPWFNVAFLVPTIPLVILVGMGMHVAWRTQSKTAWVNMLRLPAIAALLFGVVIPLFVYGRISLLLVVGCAAAAWVVIVSLIPIVRSLRREKGATGISRSVLGQSVAHLGLGFFVLGVTIVSAFGVESDRALSPGESVEVAGYEFAMKELRNVQGPNFSAIEAEVEIRKNGEYVATVRPQKRQYLVQQSPMTEAAIHARLSRDLFVAMGEPLGGEAWSLRIQYKPFIRLIWLGCLIMSFGGLVSLSDRRYRARQKAESPASAAAEAST